MTWFEDSAATELAHEHHERIEDLHDAVEQTQDQIAQTEDRLEAEVAFAAATVPEHEHPQYVTHEEFSSFRAELEESRRAAEEAAQDAEEAVDSVADVPDQAAEGVQDIPVPEAEPEPEYELVRTHGRMRRRLKE